MMIDKEDGPIWFGALSEKMLNYLFVRLLVGRQCHSDESALSHQQEHAGKDDDDDDDDDDHKQAAIH